MNHNDQYQVKEKEILNALQCEFCRLQTKWVGDKEMQ